jgi:hypothetical protein
MIILISLISITTTMLLFLIIGESVASKFEKSKFSNWWRNNIIQKELEHDDWSIIWKQWIKKTSNHTVSDLMNYLEDNYKSPKNKI